MSTYPAHPPQSDLEPSPPPVLAGWWQRVGAAVLDGLILIVLIVPFAIPMLVDAATADGGESRVLWQAVYYFFGTVVQVLYAVLLLSRPGEHNGQTWGKQALGIWVRRDDGEAMSRGRAFKREFLGKTLLGAVTFGLYALLDVLWPLWDGTNQALHDKVASTHVVARSPSAPAGWAPAAASTAAPIPQGFPQGIGPVEGLPPAPGSGGAWAPPVSPTPPPQAPPPRGPEAL